MKSIFAMVGLRALPGTYRHKGESIASIIDSAAVEAVKLEQAGFDGVILQNINDFPGMEKVNPEITAYMSAAAVEIRRAMSPRMKMGVSILWNDGEAAVAVADAACADFVRLKVFIGAMVNAEGIVQGCSGEVLEIKKRIGSRLDLWADVFDRTGDPVGGVSLEDAAVQAVKRGTADSLILTGRNPEDTAGMIVRVKEILPGTALYAGGGCTLENLAGILKSADGAIVASSFKKEGSMYNSIDEQRLQQFSSVLKSLKNIYSGNMCKK